MPTSTPPLRVGDTGGAPADPPDVQSDDALRHAARESSGPGWWDTPTGTNLLGEIRRRAIRNPARVGSTTGIPVDRNLVDDVVMAAWLVLHHHPKKVAQAVRPWAYVMSSAQRQVLEEVRAQQLLTKATSIRGRTPDVLPQAVNPIGSTTTDLATALRHEPQGADAAVDPRIPRQVHRHDERPLLDSSTQLSLDTGDPRHPWLSSFIDLLASHGANSALAVAAVDRLADVLDITTAGQWEWAARRDPILARLGLAPDQASALVALVAGSRQHRHCGKSDSVL